MCQHSSVYLHVNIMTRDVDASAPFTAYRLLLHYLTFFNLPRPATAATATA